MDDDFLSRSHPDPKKQAQEVIFNRKTKEMNHHPLNSSTSTVKTKSN